MTVQDNLLRTIPRGTAALILRHRRSIPGIAAAAIATTVLGAVPGDVDGDGVVGGSDLNRVLLAWGPCGVGEECPADLNADGVVDGADQSIVLEHWGSTAGSGDGGDGEEESFDAGGLFSSDESLEGLDLGGLPDAGPGDEGSGAWMPEGGAHVVPLPAPAVMAAMGITLGLWWRRRIVARGGIPA
jgi:hypothetical protein